MRRFLFDPAMLEGDKVMLPMAESRHIARVLRLQQGDCIELMDGREGVYSARIVEITPRVVARLTGRREAPDKGRVHLWVGQGLLKGKKMDTTIQQCTELGVGRLTPFLSSRCQGGLSELRGRRKSERWDRIVVSACKQSKRSDLMPVDELVDFSTMLAQVENNMGILRLLFYEGEEDFRLHQGLIDEEGKIDRVCILLGPEGGFSKDEIVAAQALGWQTVSLGRRILRAETATLTAVALVQYLSGNL